jgi:hypothetical protein
MNATKQKQKEVLDIVTKHFNSTNRSTEPAPILGCLYLSDDGSKCAVGMFIKDEYINDENWVEAHNDEGADCLLYRSDEILVEEYRGLGAEFWADIQCLHDEESYWDEKGLTTEGKIMVAEIKEGYDL